MNSVVITGRTTSDIELKVTQSGKNVTSFTLAVKRPYTKDEVDFLDFQAWGNTAERLSKYVKKGDMIGVRGRVQTRTWKAQDGSNRKATEIVAEEVEFLSPKKQDGSQTNGQTSGVYSGNDVEYEQMTNDDDLPF